MSEVTSVQWFPGHMAKTRRIISSDMKLVDAVIEMCDARIPYSSRNPEIDVLCAGKPRMVVLNKSDCADDSVTADWIEHYKKSGYAALAVDCRSGRNINKFRSAVRFLMREKLAAWENRGMKGRPVRLMIVGVPNVGKSSFINRLAGYKRTKVEDRPGVTRGKQWVSLEDNTELLDTPGVLWPKFEDKIVGERLAFTGAVRDAALDSEFLACRLLELLCEDYPGSLTGRYNISIGGLPENCDEISGCVRGYELLCRIGRKRGFLISGGEIDTERAAAAVLDEFRGGKLGRISLETPDERI